MTANITFSKYSEDKEFNNLYISNKIMDEIIEDSNNIIFRVPENLEKIDNLEATSVDFYATIRSLYLERRNRMIRNQSADEQDPFQEFDIE